MNPAWGTEAFAGRAIQFLLRIRRGHRGPCRVALCALAASVFLAPLVAQQVSKGRGEGRREPENMVRRRAEWFFRPRASANGHVPSLLRLHAIEERDRIIRQQGTFMQRFAPFGIAPSSTNWTPIGPQPTSNTFFFGDTSGRVNALAVDPCDSTSNTVYLGAAEGGVWKTTDGGNSWTPLTDSQPSLSTGSIALDSSTCPSGHSNAIYFGTGEENFAFDSFYGAGVLKSTDGGATWTQDKTFTQPGAGTPFSSGPFIGGLGVDPANSSILLAAVQGISAVIHSGIYRSTDGGSTWARVLPAGSSFDVATAVLFDPNDPTGNTAYAALGNPFGNSLNGVYRSGDAGQTWTLMSGLSSVAGSGATLGRISLAISKGSNPALYAAIADASQGSSPLLGLFMTTNPSATSVWTPVTSAPDFCRPQCFYDMVVAVSPTNPNLIFLGGGARGSRGTTTLYRSVSGATGPFSDVSAVNDGSSHTIHVDHHALAFTPDGSKLYAGNDGGVWSSTDVTTASAGSQHWANLNGTLQIAQFYPGASPHPSSDQIAFAGTQDNGTQMFTGGLPWTDTEACGDGGWTAVDPSAPTTIYAACEDLGSSGVLNRNLQNGTGGFLAWNTIETGINITDNADFIPSLILDTASPQTLYFGTYRLYRTQNGANNWSVVSGDLAGGGATNPTLFITTMAVAPSDSNTVYAGTSQGFNLSTGSPLPGRVWVSRNAASSAPTFTEVDATLPARQVTAIAVDPTNPQAAYVTFSGFSSCGAANRCDGLGHVFATTNAGTTWLSINGTLPDIPVNDIVVDPDDALRRKLYIATDIGVFATGDGGVTWAPLATGLPNVVVFSLKLRNTSRILTAATHGRGVWQLQLPGTPAFNLNSISPVFTSVGSSGLTLTASGRGFTPSSQINFNGAALPTSFVSSTTLTAAVPASALSSGGAVPVKVVDGASSTNSLLFSILSAVPTLTSVSPTSTSAGEPSFTLTATGSNFESKSQVQWVTGSVTDSIPAATVNSSGTQLTATIPAADVACPGTASVTIVNPAPGGGMSQTLNFTISPSSACDFLFGSPSPPSQTVLAGQSAPYNLTLSAVGSFNSAVFLSCTGLPQQAFCNFAPNPVTPTSSGAATTLTISTTARSVLPWASPARKIPLGPFGMPSLLAAVVLLIVGWRSAKRNRGRRVAALGLTLGAIAFFLTLASCGGGTSPPPGNGTPPGSYPITVVGQSGTTQHSTTVTLVVQ